MTQYLLLPISAQFFLAMFVYSLSFLAVFSLKQFHSHTPPLLGIGHLEK